MSQGHSAEDEARLRAILESSANPVHANLQRLVEAFETDYEPPAEKNDTRIAEFNAIIRPQTPAEACLAPILALFGWEGDGRRLRESLPHFERVTDCEGLCRVLSLLSYAITRRTVSGEDLVSEFLPCLFSRNGTDVLLIIDREPDGRLLAFDGQTAGWQLISAGKLRGCSYAIRADDSPEQPKSWLLSTVLKFTPAIIIAVVLSLLGNLAALTIPIFVIYVYDLGIGTKSLSVVSMLGVGASLALATGFILRKIRSYTLAYLGARIDALIAMDAFERLLQLPVAMIEGAPLGTQVSRLKQFESVRSAFTGSLATSIVDIPFIVIFLIAIAYFGGHLIWVSVSLIVVYAILLAIAIPIMRHQIETIGRTKQRINFLLHEIFGKSRIIRALRAEEVWIARHRDLVRVLTHQNYKAQSFSHFVQNLGQLLVSLAGIATLAFGTLRVTSGSMNSGELIGTMALVWRVLAPVQSTYLSVPGLIQAIQTFRQLDRLMNIRAERSGWPRQGVRRRFRGHVSVQRLVFRYPRRAEPVFRGVQMDIKPGEMIAVTGSSSSGKTTLLRLMAGLYAPTAGGILVDNRDLRQIDPADWRSAIAFLPEQSSFFYGTLSQNLRLARPDASDETVVRALREMGFDAEVEMFLAGREKRMTASEVARLPDATRKRFALARCFIKDAPVYLLDNPAASLDIAAEARLIEKLHSLKGKATIIFTTFRPSHMKLVDRLILLKDGVVALDGAPHLVMERLAAAA
jgi:ATP-binding cassette subfamily C protein/ATP-binding cassette subfamily C protein LapB